MLYSKVIMRLMSAGVPASVQFDKWKVKHFQHKCPIYLLFDEDIEMEDQKFPIHMYTPSFTDSNLSNHLA